MDSIICVKVLKLWLSYFEVVGLFSCPDGSGIPRASVDIANSG